MRKSWLHSARTRVWKRRRRRMPAPDREASEPVGWDYCTGPLTTFDIFLYPFWGDSASDMRISNVWTGGLDNTIPSRITPSDFNSQLSIGFEAWFGVSGK